METTKGELESYNNASIMALKDVISRGEGDIIHISAHDRESYYKLTAQDIQRAKSTIANLVMPITDEDVIAANRGWR